LDEIKAVNEARQSLHLPAESRVASAGLLCRVHKRAVRETYRERVIQVVIQAAARKDELLRFHAVMRFVRPLEAGFVVTNDFTELIVQSDRVWRRGVVKIENVHRRMRVLHFGFSIGDVLSRRNAKLTAGNIKLA